VSAGYRRLRSLLASVAFPAWCLGHDPSAQILCVSYAQDLADKLSRDCRHILASDWYRAIFPTRLSPQRAAVPEFDTTAQGCRLATSVGGVLPGGVRKSSRLPILSSLSKLDKRGSPMRYVSATDAKQRLAALLDAAQREPVMIRRQNRDVAVLLSPQEYHRLRALNTEEFQRFCDRIGERAAARGMTEEKLAEILTDEG
jgi:antitoxin Phd